MINYESGDILDWADKVDVIGHQVNCFGVMGGGLALQIANKWPQVLTEYRSYIKKCLEIATRNNLLGTCHAVEIKGRKKCWIANIFGQYDVGGGLQTNYEALHKALKHLKRIMDAYGLTSIALPVRLGCGLAGGDWNVVLAMIDDVFGKSTIQVTLVKFNPETKK